jgi:DNA-binding NtrC family response regulator
MVEVCLRAEGYQILAAEDAVAALDIASQVACRLNLLLTDMDMPDIDGHDLIIAIRRICPYVDTMVMSGGLLVNDVRVKNYKILPKPFRIDQLLSAVEEILDRQII